MIAKTLDATIETTARSKSTSGLWAGRIFSGLATLFLLFDSSIKLAMPPPVAEAFARLGYPVAIAPGIGMLELVCTVLYVIPRTRIVGAVFLTGFLGGAVASHVRIGDPLLTHTFFPLYIGTFVWVGLFLRDAKLRSFIKSAVLN